MDSNFNMGPPFRFPTTSLPGPIYSNRYVAFTSADPAAVNFNNASIIPKRAVSAAPLASAEVASTTDNYSKRLNIANAVLRFNTVEDALGDGLMGRVPLSVQNDDVTLVKYGANPKTWVKGLLEAFGCDYLSEPEETARQAPKQKEYFARWQQHGHDASLAVFNAKGMAHLEQSCWRLFDAVIKTHELGAIHTGGTRWYPSNIKCSERLAMIRSIIRKYALARLDVLRSWHLDEIAANPEAFIKTKLSNCWNNESRSTRKMSSQPQEDSTGEAAGKKCAVSASPKTRGRKHKAVEEVPERTVQRKRTRRSYAAGESGFPSNINTKHTDQGDIASRDPVSGTQQTPFNHGRVSHNSLLGSRPANVVSDSDGDDTYVAGSEGKRWM